MWILRFTGLLTYLLTDEEKLFLRSSQLCSYSRTSQHLMEPEGSSPCSQEPSIGPYPEPDQSSKYHRSITQWIRPRPSVLVNFHNKLIFWGEKLLAPRPTPKLDDHPLLAVHDCLFNIAVTIHIWRPSPPSATWGRAMPWWQGTHLTWIHTI
jgi:hypothetical protein